MQQAPAVSAEGLVWPGLAWMAATLFALAAFRNTALCLITVVITGVNKALQQDTPPT